MCIFNAQSFGHPFARGIQCAPGVGFSLTTEGNYNMLTKKLTNLGDGTDPSEAVTRNQLDSTGVGNITADIDLKNSYIISNSANRTFDQLKAATNSLVSYEEVRENFIGINEAEAMKTYLDVGKNFIYNVKTPTEKDQAVNKEYVDTTENNIMNAAAMIHATKQGLADYLRIDGSVSMANDLSMGNHKITGLLKPVDNTDAATKIYLMSNSNQWTDEIDGGNSFDIPKIGDLAPNKGNFHDYSHKVFYMTIYKNSQGGYKYKMGINFYRLVANTPYTLCIEMLNTDYQLWHKTEISVDKGTSTGLSIGNISVKKLSHRHLDSKNQSQFMYYHRIIINFRKLSSGNKFFLHILVNIPQEGTDLAVYPLFFKRVYMIAYGIVGTVSNIDPDKVYDYHTAFDIHPTVVVYNVDINANQKVIKNIKLDRNSDDSAATVAMVKELIAHTTNYLYSQYFEEYYDFTDANIYGINTSSSGVIINSLNLILQYLITT